MNDLANPTRAFTTRPLAPGLGAEIIGVDLSQGVDDTLFRAIYDAFLEHQVLLFGVQDLPPGRQVEFARHFGEVQIHVMNQYHADGFPELYRLSNLDENGNPTGRHPDKGTLAWHTDGSWQRVTGHATIIYSEIVPETGGETHFCDMYGAYERLSPEWKARIASLRAVHNLDFSRTRRHGEDPMTEAQKRVKTAITKSLGNDVPMLALEVVGSLGSRASQLATALNQWANRAALLAVGSPLTAVRALALASNAELPAAGPERLRWLGRHAEARDLAIFSVTEAYIEARKRLGVVG